MTEPPLKAKEGPAWEDFPEGLRRDIDKHLAGLAKPRKGTNGKRSRPCSSKTITTRRAELVAVARMAVRIGTPIESLTSLAALLDPDVVGPVLDAYWKKNGKEPNVYTIDLGWKLLSLAKQIGLDEAAIERLDDIRASLEEYRHGGLTGKNLNLIRQVLTEGIWTAQLAVAIAILMLCAGPADQSRLHRTRQEPDQARRAKLAVLAGVPAL